MSDVDTIAEIKLRHKQSVETRKLTGLESYSPHSTRQDVARLLEIVELWRPWLAISPEQIEDSESDNS